MPLRPPLNGLGTDAISLPIGGAWSVPQGRYYINTGRFASLVRYDPISTAWLPIVDGPQDVGIVGVNSDGQSYRVINPTSCPVAAVVTTGQTTAYTSAPTVTASEGGSKWTAIMGQTLTSITVIAGGSGYKYSPTVVIGPPPAPGYPATATAAINTTTGVVSSITLTNAGAGYLLPPPVSVINDPRDSTGGGCVAAPVLGNFGAVTGVVCTDPFGGTAVTSGTVPTLSFAGGGGAGAAATALMAWTVNSITVGAAGAGYDASGIVGVGTVGDGVPSLSATYTNPRFEGGFALLRARPARGWFATGSGGGLSGTVTMSDYGIICGVTAGRVGAKIVGSNAAPTTAATLTLAVGGQADVIYVQAG